MNFESFIARRYLKAKRKEKFISLISFISMAGVAVGVMALIIVIGVMTGFTQEMRNKILSVNAHIILLKLGTSIADSDRLATEVAAFPGVEAARPFIYTQVMISGPTEMKGAVLRGVDAGLIRNGGPPALTVQAGSFAALGDTAADESPPLALGNELAQSLGASVGSQVKIISPLGTLTPTGRMPRVKTFRVAAILHSGMFEFDNTLIYVAIPQIQQFLSLGDKVTGIEVQVKDAMAADTIAAALQEKLGPAYQTRDWMRMNRSLFAALKLQKSVLFIILTLIVLVAAFNIASTLIMLVMEKTRDIAILKSMGATRRSIMKIFVLEGVIIGVIGSLVGLGLGFLLTVLLQRYQFISLPSDVYYISTLPVKLQGLDVALIAGAALTITLLATLYPAWQASRQDPVEAIRYG